MENGWIKLHRRVVDKGFYKKSQYFHLWVHLLLSANHQPKEFMWNGNIILIKEGQMITGRQQLSEDTGIPESTIQDILKFLETQHQIQQQKTNKYRLITIVNWVKHQNSNTKSNNTPTSSQQHADTNKNVITKRMEEGESGINPLIPEIIKLFEGVNPACKRMYGSPPQRRACQDLLDTYGFEEVKKVISILPKTNKVTYMPTITTPNQLWNEYQKLKDKLIQEKNKPDKNKPNYIL